MQFYPWKIQFFLLSMVFFKAEMQAKTRIHSFMVISRSVNVYTNNVHWGEFILIYVLPIAISFAGNFFRCHHF